MVRLNWFRFWEPHHIPERQDENKGTHCEVPLCRPWFKVSFGFPQLGPNFRRIHNQWTLLGDTYRLVACCVNQNNMTSNNADAMTWACFNVTERTIHLDKRARQYFKVGTEIVLLSNRPIHSVLSTKPGPARASVRNTQIPWRTGWSQHWCSSTEKGTCHWQKHRIGFQPFILGAAFVNVQKPVIAAHDNRSTIKIFPIRELVALWLTQQYTVVVGLEQHFVVNHGAAATLVKHDAFVNTPTIIFETRRCHLLARHQ